MSFSRRMSHLDAAFWAMETPQSHVHFSLVAVYRGSSAGAVESLRGRLGDRAEGFDSLHLVVREQWGGLVTPILVDDPRPLDHEYHVSRQTCEGDLDGWLQSYLARPLDPSKPLWQAVVVDDVPDKSFAIVLKAHHAVFDGAAGLRVALDLLSNSPRKTERRRRGVSEGVGALVGNTLQLATWPLRSMRAVARLLVRVEKISPESKARKAFSGPRSYLNVPVGSSGRAVARVSVPQDLVASVRREANCTDTDVLLSALSTAIIKVNKQPMPSRPLVAALPVAQSGAEWGTRAGNRLGLWFVSLETHRATVDQRLRGIAESSRRARVSLRLKGVDTWERYAGFCLPLGQHALAQALQKCRIARLLRPAASVVFAHLTGPRATERFDDATLTALWPFGTVVPGVSCNVTVVSYGSDYFVGFVGAQSLQAELEELAEEFAAAVGARD